MDKTDYRVEQLNDLQVVDLLNMASPHAEFKRFSSMSSGELVQTTRAKLDGSGLDSRAAARLLGVNELTAKRWFESTDSLGDQARLKLAGLCLLLSFKEDPAFVPEATGLVNEAIACLRHDGPAATANHRTDCGKAVGAVFGPSGLMAAALYVSTEVGESEGTREKSG